MGPCLSKSSRTAKNCKKPSINTIKTNKKPDISGINENKLHETNEIPVQVPEKKPVSLRNSHNNRKKNLTSFNMTDCDVNYTNPNDISPIILPRFPKESCFNLRERSFNSHKTRESRLISQENFAFLKKNLDNYFRNREAEPLDLPSPQNPVLNISVIELEEEEEKNQANKDFPKRFPKENSMNLVVDTVIMKGEPMNNLQREELPSKFGTQVQGDGVSFNNNDEILKDPMDKLYLFTQEFAKDSQEDSSSPCFEDLEFFLRKNQKDGEEFVGEELFMLEKYTKLWHKVCWAYLQEGLLVQALNGLVPLASLYLQMGRRRQILACYIDASEVLLMLKIDRIPQSKRINRFLDILNEEIEKKQTLWQEIKCCLAFIGFFQGVIENNEELLMKNLQEIEEQDILSVEEYQEMIDFARKKRNEQPQSLQNLNFLANFQENKHELKEFIHEKLVLCKWKLFDYWKKNLAISLPSVKKQRFLPGILVKMGNLLRIWLELPQHAIFFYESAYRHDTNYVKALFFIALTLRGLGKSELALEFYAQALKKDPFFVDCWFNTGNIFLEDCSMLKEAENAYCQALVAFNFSKEKPLVQMGRTYNLLAEIQRQKGRFAVAVMYNLKGVLHDVTFEENYPDCLRNLQEAGISGVILEYFQWISQLISENPENLAGLRVEKKKLAKMLTTINASSGQRQEFKEFCAVIKEEAQISRLEQRFRAEKTANQQEILLALTAQCFQELEEYFSFMSSQEKVQENQKFYAKLLLVFNCP